MNETTELNDYQKNLLRAKDIIGSYDKMGKILGLTQRGVNKWFFVGRPPRTEYTGETNYAGILSEATGGEVTTEQLRPPIRSLRA